MNTIHIFKAARPLAACALFCLFLITGCSEKADIDMQKADDFFHLRQDGAYLPVWVRGNTASQKILIYIQGGPGLNTIDFATVDYPDWKNSIEQDYAIAYYDQRGLGNAQGNFSMESVTLDQYLTDLRKIVQLLHNRYPEAELYLFGHSFGGWLTYLYDKQYQSDPVISGIIAANAPFTTDQNEVRWQFRQQFLARVARDFVENGESVDYWQEVLDWTEAHPVIDELEERRQWNRYVIKGLTDYEVEVPLKTGTVLKAIFGSSINVFPTLMDVQRIDEVSDRLFEDQAGIELLQELDQLHSPLLLITGSYDDIAPVEEFEFAFDRIGSAVKRFEVLPDAGHDAMLNQPEMFRNLLREFLE